MKASSALFITTLVFFAGCAAPSAVAPSQNSTLHSVSPSKTAVTSGGAMQNSLDKWLKEDWVPTTSSDKKEVNSSKPSSDVIKEVTSSSSTPAVEEDFTLQQYVDKWTVYNKKQDEHPKKETTSTYSNEMPLLVK
jgi:hypothetical protein